MGVLAALAEYEDLHAGKLGESHILKVEGIRPKAASTKTFILSDQQAGYHNKRLHQLVLAALKVMKPSRIVLPGDLIDFPAVGSYADGSVKESVQESINSGYGVVKDYRDAAGRDCIIEYIPGNHEHRLTKYLLKNAPALYGVKGIGQEFPAMSVPGLLRLEELNIRWVGGLDPNEYPMAHVQLAYGLQVYHGWIARKHGGMSALASIENKGQSLIVGHTHRLAHLVKTTHHQFGPIYQHAIEAGTLCDASNGLDWTVDPNWQNGFVIIHHYDNIRWDAQLVHWDGDNKLLVPPYVFTEEYGAITWELLK